MKIEMLEKGLKRYEETKEELKRKYDLDTYAHFHHVVNGTLFNLRAFLYMVEDGDKTWADVKPKYFLRSKIIKYYLREFQEDPEFRDDESKSRNGHLPSAAIDIQDNHNQIFFQALKEHYLSRTQS